jgi:hypothetical protein
MKVMSILGADTATDKLNTNKSKLEILKDSIRK